MGSKELTKVLDFETGIREHNNPLSMNTPKDSGETSDTVATADEDRVAMAQRGPAGPGLPSSNNVKLPKASKDPNAIPGKSKRDQVKSVQLTKGDSIANSRGKRSCAKYNRGDHWNKGQKQQCLSKWEVGATEGLGLP